MNYLGKLNKQIAQSAAATCLRQTNYSFSQNGFLLVNRVFIDFDESHHRTSAVIASFSRKFFRTSLNWKSSFTTVFVYFSMQCKDKQQEWFMLKQCLHNNTAFQCK